MITENLSTLKIHKLTQAQYDRELEAGRIDPNALYLTPDEDADLSQYATIEQLNNYVNAYVWKKCNVDNVTVYGVTETNTTDITLSSYSNIGTDKTYENADYADSYEVVDGRISLVNPTTININTRENAEKLIGKYIYSYYNGKYYYIPEDATATRNQGTFTITIYINNGILLTVNSSIVESAGSQICYIASDFVDTYPTSGKHTDGYWYEYVKQVGDASSAATASDSDVLDFVVEMGYVNPVISDSSVVYQDNNNNIYVF